MGKLIKTHWARLIVLTAAIYQLAASIHGYFWPKIFWDFLTKNLDGAVKPAPILQTINLVFALCVIGMEWPLPLITRLVPAIHRSIEFRLVVYPISAMACLVLYQATNAGLYYMIGIGIYFWGFCEGEGISPTPWTLPLRMNMASGRSGKV